MEAYKNGGDVRGSGTPGLQCGYQSLQMIVGAEEDVEEFVVTAGLGPR